MIGLLMLAAVGSFTSGNKLYADCTGDAGQRLECSNYVVGVADAISIMQDLWSRTLVCAPNEITQGQVRDIATKYLRDHPEERHAAASGQVILALREAFPCPK